MNLIELYTRARTFAWCERMIVMSYLNLLVFGVKYTEIAVMGSFDGSLYSSVTNRSLSFMRSGNFCMSAKFCGN